MIESVLKDRFLKFASAVYRLIMEFPKETVYFMIKGQILRCSSSGGANYRAASRGKSGPDFINKLKIVEEQLDETLYWLDYINGVDQKWKSHTEPLDKEGNELLSIMGPQLKPAGKTFKKPNS